MGTLRSGYPCLGFSSPTSPWASPKPSPASSPIRRPRKLEPEYNKQDYDVSPTRLSEYPEFFDTTILEIHGSKFGYSCPNLNNPILKCQNYKYFGQVKIAKDCLDQNLIFSNYPTLISFCIGHFRCEPL